MRICLPWVTRHWKQVQNKFYSQTEQDWFIGFSSFKFNNESNSWHVFFVICKLGLLKIIFIHHSSERVDINAQGAECFLCSLFHLHNHTRGWNSNDSTVMLLQRRSSQGPHLPITSFLVFSDMKMYCFIYAGKWGGEKSTIHGKSAEGKYNLEWHFSFSFPTHRLPSGFFLQFPLVPAQPRVSWLQSPMKW